MRGGGSEEGGSEAASSEMTQRLRPPMAAPVPKTDSKTSTPGQESDPESHSGGARSAESGGGWFDRPESLDTEPVGPEATAPGRAGPPVASGSTSSTSSGTAGASADSAEDTPSEANDTVRLDRPGVVKVIGATRRFHSSSCPLVKGAEPSSVQSMQKAEAEAKGLTPCAVCQHDHQRVS
ncbi:hypothetical protein GCM10020219_022260 [Nonomuraea dietziae]